MPKKVVKEYDVYTFEELSPEAKEKVLEDFRDINVDGDSWSDWLIEEWQDKLSEAGWGNPKDIEIAFSGFWSQGDGASFTINRLSDEGILKLMETYKLDVKYPLIGDYDYLDGTITRSERYVHENSTDLSLNGEVGEGIDQDAFNSQLDGLEKDLEEIMRDLNKQIYRELEKTYDEATTDEAIIDTILANEFEFTSDGKQF